MDNLWLVPFAIVAIVAAIVIARLLSEAFKWLLLRHMTEEDIKAMEDDPARLIW